jgi:hypothetical protein
VIGLLNPRSLQAEIGIEIWASSNGIDGLGEVVCLVISISSLAMTARVVATSSYLHT